MPADLPSGSDRSARHRSNGEAGYSASGWLDRFVPAHVAILIVGISWSFGGQIAWAREVLLAWGSVGIGLFLLLAWRSVRQNRSTVATLLRDLWPLLLFALLVGISCFNPGAATLARGDESFRVLVTPPHVWLPSSARPDLSRTELWQFLGIVLSCYNLTLAASRRGTLRTVLFVMAANGLALAIFGSFQKLSGATGLWFGHVPSPQLYFFSSFVYHNHWGAFTLLNTVACLGLLFHSARHNAHRDIWHSPVLAGAVATFFLAATAPLSGSRSSSALLGLVVGAAVIQFLWILTRTLRTAGRPTLVPIAGIVLMALLAFAAAGYFARDMIAERTELTARQLAHLRQSDLPQNQRLILYRDTWRMAQARPWFGWGLESYGDVFQAFNSQRSVEGWQPFYREAHNDWLQALAEVGVVGTGLLVLTVLVPLWRTPWRRGWSTLPGYLLAGCGLLAAYAVLEFPFANPSVMIGFWACLFIARRYVVLNARHA